MFYTPPAGAAYVPPYETLNFTIIYFTTTIGRSFVFINNKTSIYT